MPLVAGAGAITTAITLSLTYPSRLYLPVIALIAAAARR